MEIINVKVGMLETNCYILKKNNETIVIDPGDDFLLINNYLKNTKLIGVIITHNHFDHVGAIKELQKEYNFTVYNKSNLNEGQHKIGNFAFEVIYTEGHTDDSISIYFCQESVMFTGDFIFKNTIGRCNLPTGDYNEMLNSIQKIKKYNDDITIYPGHGEITKLGLEKKFNEYFKIN